MSSESPYRNMRYSDVRITSLAEVDTVSWKNVGSQLIAMLTAGCSEEQQYAASSSVLLELGCRDLQEDLAARGAGWLVAWHVSTPIGLVCLASSGSDSPDTGVLAGLYVDPAWRRQGVGRSLTLAAIQAAKAKGLRSVNIYVAVASPARLLYAQLGIGDGFATEQADFLRFEWRLDKENKACRELARTMRWSFILRAVAVAMGVAVVALSILQPTQVERVGLLLGIGLTSLAISTLKD